MKDKGIAHIGIGTATGDDKSIEAMRIAVASPLLETTIEGASHVLINISGDVSLPEVNEAASFVRELAGDDANIIFGATYDDSATDTATITVIATGVEDRSSVPNVKGLMSGFKSSSSKPKTNEFGYGNNQSAQTSTPKPQPTISPEPKYTAPTYTAPKPRREESGGINIPDFLRRR